MWRTKAALSDGIITEEERSLLKKIRELLGVPKHRASQIMAEVKANKQNSTSLGLDKEIPAEPPTTPSQDSQGSAAEELLTPGQEPPPADEAILDDTDEVRQASVDDEGATDKRDEAPESQGIEPHVGPITIGPDVAIGPEIKASNLFPGQDFLVEHSLDKDTNRVLGKSSESNDSTNVGSTLAVLFILL